MPVSFLSAESLLITRLKGVVPSGTDVKSILEIKEISDLSQYQDTVYVSPNGFTLGSSDNTGRIQKINQRWAVVIAVRGVTDILSGEDVRSGASPIIDSILIGLLGYKLSNEHQSLRLLTSPPAQNDDGFSFYPLIFETVINYQGSLV